MAVLDGGMPPYVLTWYSADLLAVSESVDANLMHHAEHLFQIPTNCDTMYSVFAVLEDSIGCSAEATGTVTLQDHEAPFIRGTIDTTVDQMDHLPLIATTVAELEALGVSISDNCTMDSALIVTYSETIVGECPIVVTRIYTITDQCHNTSVVNQVIRVQDVVLPVITCPELMVTDCISNLPPVYNYNQFRLAGGIISDDRAVDTLSFALTSEYMVDSISSIEASVIRIYAISDQCGNEAQCSQPIVLIDTIPPDFTVPSDRWIHRKSDGTYNADPLMEDEVIDESDNCDTELNAMWSDRDTVETVPSYVMSEFYAMPEPYVIIYRTWSLEDNSGNRTEKEQKIRVYPVQNITCSADMEITLNYGMCDTVIWDIGTVSLESRDSNNILVSITNNAPVDGVYPVGTTEVTWLAIDAYGNSFSCMQTITVNYPPCGMDENYVAEDTEHNIYYTVRIGCDCWTQRNLESRYYSDGRRIESASGYYTPRYPDTTSNISIFGRLYNWYDAVDTAGGLRYNSQGHIQGVCPSGWYLPTVEQYYALNHYGSSALKSPLYWLDGGGTNITGFSSLPGGYYNAVLHHFLNLMGNAYYWCGNIELQSFYSISMELGFDCEFFTESQDLKWNRYSIRCIKEKEE
ncbi:MAG: FISUMP domain-containing protein [Bacteroidales bacterium]